MARAQDVSIRDLACLASRELVLKPQSIVHSARRNAEPVQDQLHRSQRNSSPFPLLHHLRKLLEQIMRIMRPRRGFRVILHAEQRQIPMPQAFQRLVVQIDVRQLDFALRPANPDRRRNYGCAP